MKKIFFLSVCLITIIAGSQMLFSDAAANLKPAVISIIGSVEYKTQNEWKPLTKDTLLNLNDTIKTGAQASAEIKLAENTVIKLAENTEVTLMELKSEASKKKSVFGKGNQQVNKIKLNMTNGQIFSKLQKNPNLKNQFQLNTPVAVCGVRGTEFITSHSGENTNVDVIEGTVDVYNLKFPKKNIKVTAGQTTSVVENKIPETPKPLSADEKEKFKKLFAPAETALPMKKKKFTQISIFLTLNI